MSSEVKRCAVPFFLVGVGLEVRSAVPSFLVSDSSSLLSPVSGAARVTGQTGYMAAESAESVMERRASSTVMHNVMKKPDLSDPKLRAKVCCHLLSKEKFVECVTLPHPTPSLSACFSLAPFVFSLLSVGQGYGTQLLR